MKFRYKDLLIIFGAFIVAVLPALIVKISTGNIEIDPIKFSEEWCKIIISATLLIYIAKFVEYNIEKNSEQNSRKNDAKYIEQCLGGIESETNKKHFRQKWNDLYYFLSVKKILTSEIEELNKKCSNFEKWKKNEFEFAKNDVKLKVTRLKEIYII